MQDDDDGAREAAFEAQVLLRREAALLRAPRVPKRGFTEAGS